MNFLIKPIKHAVSGRRFRYTEEGFDLDLTYITPNIIAMGLPSEGVESLYRNKLEDVAKFFNTKHKGHYLIINLSQKTYNVNKFENQVLTFGFLDHHTPPLPLLFTIVKSMTAWLQADPENVVGVHCKAGKGRTGIVISCALMYCGLIPLGSPDEAMTFFEAKRREGVENPSQKRCIRYFDEVLVKKTYPSPQRLKLQKIFIHTPSRQFLEKMLRDPAFNFSIFQMKSLDADKIEKKLVFELKTATTYGDAASGSASALSDAHVKNADTNLLSNGVVSLLGNDIISINFLAQSEVTVRGDIYFECESSRGIVFRCSFNTGFVPLGLLRFDKNELDDIIKKGKIKDDLMMDIIFEKVDINPQSESEEDIEIDKEVERINLMYFPEKKSVIDKTVAEPKKLPLSPKKMDETVNEILTKKINVVVSAKDFEKSLEKELQSEEEYEKEHPHRSEFEVDNEDEEDNNESLEEILENDELENQQNQIINNDVEETAT